MSAIGNLMRADRKTRGSARKRYDHGQPISRANPLPIAILFSCLALVFLSPYRPPVHALTIDLPPQSILPDRPYSEPVDVHVIVPTAHGTIEWNGEAITEEQLARFLDYGLSQPIEPELVFMPEGNASYDLAAKTLNIIKKSGVTKFCFGGLKEHSVFSKDSSSTRLMLSYGPPPSEPADWVPARTRSNSHRPPQCSIVPEAGSALQVR